MLETKDDCIVNVLALIKFFRDERHLDSLLNGNLYCNTPESYRFSGQEGASDKNESCVLSFRQSRGDPQAVLVVGGYQLKSLTAMTMHGNDLKDMWLHCWVALTIPSDEQGMRSLVCDILTMRHKFGCHYAVLPHYNIKPFVERLRTLTHHRILYGLVDYSDNERDWSVRCKASCFTYQREYRFAFGQCDHMSTTPLCICDSAGFSPFLQKNPPIEMIHSESKRVWFHLDNVSCQLNLDS